ncbi:MAG: hypothetical protein ACYCTL_13320 [Acidimicrobiales bacterium]
MHDNRHAQAGIDIETLTTALPPDTLEHKVLAMRWGLGCHERPHTVDEIANALEVSETEVMAILRMGVGFASLATGPN